MGNFAFLNCKLDRKYLFAYILAFLCSVMCGIVLCKTTNCNIFLQNVVDEYIYNVFNFLNSAFIFSHICAGLIYFYLIFLISRFTKFKYLTLICVFIRGIFFGLYCCILCSTSFSGVIVCVFVYLPTNFISFALGWLVASVAVTRDLAYALAYPAGFAAADLVIFLIFLNIIFRLAISIV